MAKTLKCNKCKKYIKSGIRYTSKRGTICEECLEEELKKQNVIWKFASEMDENDECNCKGLYDNEDFVFVKKEDGRWYDTDIYFTIFD